MGSHDTPPTFRGYPPQIHALQSLPALPLHSDQHSERAREVEFSATVP
jgi:hypothetical protein